MTLERIKRELSQMEMRFESCIREIQEFDIHSNRLDNIDMVLKFAEIQGEISRLKDRL